MIYLLALIGAVAVSYLVWKAFGPQPKEPTGPRRGPIGPDDDADFMLDLGRDGTPGPRPGTSGPSTPPTAPPAPGSTPRDRKSDDEPTDGAPHRDDPRPGAST